MMTVGYHCSIKLDQREQADRPGSTIKRLSIHSASNTFQVVGLLCVCVNICVNIYRRISHAHMDKALLIRVTWEGGWDL